MMFDADGRPIQQPSAHCGHIGYVRTSSSELGRLHMDATLRRPKKIGLLNHMGAGNLGDDATQTVVIQHIRRHWPNSEIYGFSMNPSDTQARQGIPSYPIRHQTWDIGNYTNVSKTTISKATFKDNVKTAAGEHQVILGALKVLNTLAVKMPRALFQEVPFLARSFHTLRRFDLLIIKRGRPTSGLLGRRVEVSLHYIQMGIARKVITRTVLLHKCRRWSTRPPSSQVVSQARGTSCKLCFVSR